MSAECEQCGYHALECICERITPVRLRDEITNLKGLINAVYVIKDNIEHKSFKLDPLDTILIIIEEKLKFIDEGLQKL